MAEDIALINEVRKHPAIYAQNSIEYRSKTERALAWEDISEALNRTENACKGRWKTIRDRYVREHARLLAIDSDAEENVVCEWHLYDYLNFLKCYIKPRCHVVIKALPAKRPSRETKRKHQEMCQDDEDDEENCTSPEAISEVISEALEVNAYDDSFAFVDSVDDSVGEPVQTKIQAKKFAIDPHIDDEVDEAACVNAGSNSTVSNHTLKRIEEFLNDTKIKNDGILSSIGEFIDQLPVKKRLAFKMDVLNYAYSRYNELVE